eukprot:1373636-Pleurochrysis_carterae.AAC.1
MNASSVEMFARYLSAAASTYSKPVGSILDEVACCASWSSSTKLVVCARTRAISRASFARARIIVSGGRAVKDVAEGVGERLVAKKLVEVLLEKLVEACRRGRSKVGRGGAGEGGGGVGEHVGVGMRRGWGRGAVVDSSACLTSRSAGRFDKVLDPLHDSLSCFDDVGEQLEVGEDGHLNLWRVHFKLEQESVHGGAVWLPTRAHQRDAVAINRQLVHARRELVQNGVAPLGRQRWSSQSGLGGGGSGGGGSTDRLRGGCLP